VVPEYGFGAGCCERGNEALDLVEDKELINQLRYHQLLMKKNSASWMLFQIKDEHFILI
jgi:hypothetical protein